MTQPLAFVIEDEPDLAYLFAEAMRVAGFEAEILARGDEALARLAEVVPHLVILDLYLPAVDGATLLRHVRSDPRFAGTRVVVISADAYLARTLERDADLTLIKPVSFTQLVTLARRLSPVAGGRLAAQAEEPRERLAE